jgi:hypothetical protein
LNGDAVLRTGTFENSGLTTIGSASMLLGNVSNTGTLVNSGMLGGLLLRGGRVTGTGRTFRMYHYDGALLETGSDGVGRTIVDEYFGLAGAITKFSFSNPQENTSLKAYTARIRGTVILEFDPNYVVVPGTYHTIIEMDSAEGQFANIQAPQWAKVVYDTNRVRVFIVPESSSLLVFSVSVLFLARRRRTPQIECGTSRDSLASLGDVARQTMMD